MSEEQTLRILGFDIENVLRVSVVRLRPDGNVLELTGKNANGKSSVIDAIWCALGGTIPPDPIHAGAEEGTIKVDIGNAAGKLVYRVRRKIRKADNPKGYAPSLTVEGEDGAKFSSPQKLLDGLVGALSCDPLQFIAMPAAQQFDLLKQFVPGVDFAAIAKANADDYTKRTDVNRRAKENRTRADGMVIELANAVTMDEDALVSELAGAAEANGKVEKFRAALAQKAAQADGLDHRAAQNRATAAEVGKEIVRLQKVMADAIAAADADEEAASSLRLDISDAGEEPKRVDTAELQAKISEARQHNAKVAAASAAVAERDRLNNEALDLERQSAALTKAMEERDAVKEKAISEAKMPVPGLSFGDGAILLNGHPLENASQAQKLNIAIAVAAAAQPKLRFVTTKNAALLDKDSWQAMIDIAEKMDLLIIAETVDSDRPSAVVIEDGMVRK